MNNLNDIFFAPVANQDLTYDQVLEDVQRYFADGLRRCLHADDPALDGD